MSRTRSTTGRSVSFRRRRPLLFLLLAGFVAGVVWLTRDAWRASRRKNRPSAAAVGPTRPAVVSEAHPAPSQPIDQAPPAGQARPATEPAPAFASMPGPDDLVRIEGIGPKIAAALVEEGISTFEALAVASPEQLRDALARQGLRFAPSLGTWPAQARLLADGDEAGFVELTSRLGRGGVAT